MSVHLGQTVSFRMQGVERVGRVVGFKSHANGDEVVKVQLPNGPIWLVPEDKVVVAP